MPRQTSDAQVQALRRFNRFYTQRIGVLDKGLLGSAYSLTQVRVLFELGQRGGATATAIGDALSLDAGYLSRIVQRLAHDGLLVRRSAAADARQIMLSLTAQGQRTLRTLDRKSCAQASALLDELPATARHDLLENLQSVQHALAPPERDAARVRLRAARPGDLGWAIERHGHLYAAEHGMDASFEALVARLFADFAAGHDAVRERLWIADLDGLRVGCVFVVRSSEDPDLAQLRCLLVDPAGRGFGVGRRLVRRCVDFARDAGYRGMTLWTVDGLAAARRLYEQAGFRLVREEPCRSFGRDVVNQTWRLAF